MGIFNQRINIKEIIFLTANNDITLYGTASRDLLTYETQISINSSQLNMVINTLQRKNESLQVAEMFESRSTENGQILFYFDGTILQNSEIELDNFSQNEVLKQIRA
ncbi:MAG: hypothetical protein RI883_2154 [Bacteroidota bacterium]|jgi:hypothetical protein